MATQRLGRVKVGIVGIGWWGQKILEALRKSARMQVSGVSDPAPSDAAQAHCVADGVPLFSTYDELLALPDLDVVILTTPNSLHEMQIIQAAQAGKHVFCEKPLALSLESAQRSVHACLQSRVLLGIGHEKRFEPPIQQLREDVVNGVFGDILQIEGNFSQNKFVSFSQGNWRLSKKEAGCGPMTATGIHLLDLAVSLVGPAVKVCARSANHATGFECGDSVSAQIVFESGVVATVNAMLSTPFISRLAVYGTKGWVEITDNSHVENPTGWVVTRSVDGDPSKSKQSEDIQPSTPVLDNLDAFAAAVAAKQQSMYPVSLQEMLDTTALLDAVAMAVDQDAVMHVNRVLVDQWKTWAD